MNLSSKVIIAFDFGLKHIGVAIGQEITSTAQTFRSLQANNGEPDWNILDILIKEWNPKLFVVGNPLNMDGSDSEMKKNSDKFSNLINKRYNIPVELIDERLTTREAKDRLRSAKENSISVSADTHQISAQIILESWFSESR
jgi:putative Holliday junction resolvase